MLGDREIDESLVAELVKVSQTSVDQTSVSPLLTAAAHQEGRRGVEMGGVGGDYKGSEVRGQVGVGGGFMQDIIGQVQQSCQDLCFKQNEMNERVAFTSSRILLTVCLQADFAIQRHLQSLCFIIVP